MNNETKNKNFNLGSILLLLPAALLFAGIYWVCLPSFSGYGILWALVAALFFPGIIEFGICYDEFFYFICEENTAMKKTVVYGQLIVAGLIFVYILIAGIGSSAMFHAQDYTDSFVVEEVDTAQEDLPSFEDVAKISLMDTESAKKLGDRTLGGLTEYVSQYNVSNRYTTISYKGKVVKVAPLIHGGFFKAMNNATIPGYVMVDTVTNEAKFVEVEGGITYSTSAYFSKDLIRHLRSKYKAEMLGNYTNFQIDEEGHPYYVITTLEYSVWKGAKVPSGAILVDAVSGEMKKYSLTEIPAWVEQVVDGDMVETLYDRHGKFINGFWNLSDTGKTQVTDDYGYMEKDGDIYIYTGVTSVVADESNIGFIMVNSRTGECKYYPIPGAEEYSAKAAAEGMVQNFGYTASFPSLVMYGDEPTYVMVLKDANGLVKMYAMVNMKNYTIVAVEETLQACQKAYVKAMTSAGSAANIEIEGIETVKETVVVSSVEFINVEGETIVYVKTEDGRVFKQAFAENENLILIDAGEKVEVEYVELETITAATISIK